MHNRICFDFVELKRFIFLKQQHQIEVLSDLANFLWHKPNYQIDVIVLLYVEIYFFNIFYSFILNKLFVSS